MSNKTIAVITGGGSYGAYHSGTLAALNLNFDAVYGTSTGALMAPLVALGKYMALENAYTSLEQYDIFNSWATNPIKKDGKINIAKSALRIISGNNSLGATDKALKNTITKFYTAELHDAIYGKKDVIVNAVDLTKPQPSKVEYFNGKDTAYEVFKEYMRASASFPGIMSPVYLNESELVDGGLAETASIYKALESQPHTIHVFIHSQKLGDVAIRKKPTKNFLHMIMRVLNTFMDEVKQNDLGINKLKELLQENGVKELQLHYMKKEFTNRLVFNKAEMRTMWQMGFENATNSENNETFIF